MSVLVAFVKEKLADEKNISKVAHSAGVPMPWLRLLAQDRIPNPGVDRIEKLYSYYSGKQLTV